MPLFRIHLINAKFESSEDCEYASLDSARKAAVGTAIRVAMESVTEGHQTSAVEVRIEDGERVLSHSVVNLSVTEMLDDLGTADSESA